MSTSSLPDSTQTPAAPPSPSGQEDQSARRLESLRGELINRGLDGFLVPMADEYQSEYVPASARRVEFLSGFTGSAGFIAVLRDKAAFFTDGRYTLQARQQIPAKLFALLDVIEESPAAWLGKQAGQGTRIGYDPWLHTEDSVERYRKALEKAEAELVPVEQNPLDTIWPSRPPAPAEPIFAHDVTYAGQSSADKRKAIAQDLDKQGADAVALTDPTSIAWLLNVRGGDVPNAPLPLSFAILYRSGKVKWFVDPRKLTHGLEAFLGPDIAPEHPGQFPHALDRLGMDKATVRIDPASAPAWVFARLRAAKAVLNHGEDPCVMPRACKNETEINGMRAAHRRDGAALAKFFAWLDEAWASEQVTELSAEEKLAEFRAQGDMYRGPSFDTICGAGGHGAIVHYRATKATNAKLTNGQLVLIDSGGQYTDGTTDVTRTVALGQPSPEMRERFTRVLKGHIALAAVKFPEGIAGAHLDVLARQALWAVGLDYDHGTGHGVGSYLGVHEGPQSVSRRGMVALKPGMILSNEPGYYKAGSYGIRIENLQVVVKDAVLGSERPMLGFETLTLAPIDTRLVDRFMLTSDEARWLNDYHTRVNDLLRPMVDEATARWLMRATAPV
ncbi:MAG: aminopeptidase P family protein [Bdellovibrionales bacterium]